MATIDIKNPKQRQISTIELLERMEKQYKNIPMEAILKQEVHNEQIAAFLLGWRLKPETTEEFRKSKRNKRKSNSWN